IAEHESNRLRDPAGTLGQLGFRLRGDLSYSTAPDLAGRVFPIVMCPGIASPVIRCYNRHCSIPRIEGLTVGLERVGLRTDSQALALCYKLYTEAYYVSRHIHRKICSLVYSPVERYIVMRRRR